MSGASFMDTAGNRIKYGIYIQINSHRQEDARVTRKRSASGGFWTL